MGHDHVLRRQILVNKVTVVQIAQLTEHLTSYLRKILLTKRRSQIPQMEKILPALLIVLAHDVDIIL